MCEGIPQFFVHVAPKWFILHAALSLWHVLFPFIININQIKSAFQVLSHNKLFCYLKVNKSTERTLSLTSLTPRRCHVDPCLFWRSQDSLQVDRTGFAIVVKCMAHMDAWQRKIQPLKRRRIPQLCWKILMQMHVLTSCAVYIKWMITRAWKCSTHTSWWSRKRIKTRTRIHTSKCQRRSHRARMKLSFPTWE